MKNSFFCIKERGENTICFGERWRFGGFFGNLEKICEKQVKKSHKKHWLFKRK